MSNEYIAQAGAIPFRIADSQIEVLMIRRKCGGKWSIPKGNVDPGCTHEEAAAIEAIEEAGIEGELLPKAIGEFTYGKWGGICRVRVFIMKVTRMHERWREQEERERAWFPAHLASDLAGRDSVKSLLQKLPEFLQK